MNLKQAHSTHTRQSRGFWLSNLTKDSFLRDFQHIWGLQTLLIMGSDWRVNLGKFRHISEICDPSDKLPARQNNPFIVGECLNTLETHFASLSQKYKDLSH